MVQMNWWNLILLLFAYTVFASALLFGVLWATSFFGASTVITTIVAALGGALVASLGPVVTGALGSLWQQRDIDERIRDEASRIALDLTRMDYDLRQRALPSGQTKNFLAPAKVYREFYKAIVELRTAGTWPKAVEDLGLLNIFEVARPPGGAQSSDKTEGDGT